MRETNRGDTAVDPEIAQAVAETSCETADQAMPEMSSEVRTYISNALS